MNKKIRAAIVGYGNIGRYVIDTIEHTADVEIAGVVRRSVDKIPAELEVYKVTNSINNLVDVDVAILCLPSRLTEDAAKDILAKGINTVDSFDIHQDIVSLRASLNEVARKHGAVAVVSSGWEIGRASCRERV